MSLGVFCWDSEETLQQKPKVNSAVRSGTESGWNMVLRKTELGSVLTDTSAALRCRVEIRCGEIRGVFIQRDHILLAMHG